MFSCRYPASELSSMCACASASSTYCCELVCQPEKYVFRCLVALFVRIEEPEKRLQSRLRRVHIIDIVGKACYKRS